VAEDCSDTDMLANDGDADVVKVFQVCGQPTLSGGVRHRRKAGAGFSSPYNWNQDMHHGGRGHSSSTSDGRMEPLIRDIRERLLTTRDFWKNLPDSVCSQLAAVPFELTNCWNGLSISRFLRVVGLRLSLKWYI